MTIPELIALQSSSRIIRIPAEIDIPVTPRLMRLIDTSAFQKLSHIRQLGLVAQVYPGATHSRFEHSLGVYRNGLLFLQRLSSLPEFRREVSSEEMELLIVAGLLHDLGHWPFCHAIEDMRIPAIERHEQYAKSLLQQTELADLLDRDWKISVDSIVELLAPADKANLRYRLLGNILSGPIDIDKLDYLDRDSLHAGVPYGRYFDRGRLMSQLCIGPDGQSLAITDKARTAAEMMVFARYVMFSEVYWHHAVRSATSMLQRVFWELLHATDSSAADPIELWNLLRSSDEAKFIRHLKMQSHETKLHSMVDGLFGERRLLYKRLAEFHCLESPDLHTAIARRPYPELVALGNRLSVHLASQINQPIAATEVLVDAPPVKLEVQFNVQVRQRSGAFLSLGELSPVASTLANQQFDSLVKRVRIFVTPRLRDSLRHLDIGKALEQVL